MQLPRGAVAVAPVALVVLAGCDRGADQDGGGGRGDAAGAATQAQVAPAADQAASGQGEAAFPGKAGSTEAAAQVRLVDLNDRIARTATVDLEVDKGQLDETINKASDAVLKANGIYVGSSTSAPAGEPASGQVTFRVPVDAFGSVLRQLKGLGAYRGEQSSAEDVTSQYVDLNGQLAAWRAQERVYLRLLELVAVVWAIPVAVLAGLALLGARTLRRPRPA
jgi:hypothetical protein